MQSKYKEEFRAKGWTDPTQLRSLRMEHYDELGIKVPGHKKKLHNALEALDLGPAHVAGPAPSHVKYNSTSSLYIDSTISKPCIDEIIFCVSIAIHDRIHEGEEKRAAAKAEGSNFPIMFDATGVNPLFNQEQPADGPTEQSIFQIIKSIYTIAEFSSECLVISLLYIERVRSLTNVPLLNSNWQPMLLAAMIVAQKGWDDKSLLNVDFSVICSAYTLKDINNLEKAFLDLIEYNVSITASLYASYYFELRTLCEKAGPGRETAKPLSADAEKLLLREDAIKQLEVHSQNAQKEFQKDKRWQSHGGALMPSRVG